MKWIRLKSLRSLRHGLGTTLFMTSLNTGDSDEDREFVANDVQKALECASVLVNSDNISVIKEGHDILCRFMSRIGISSSSLRSDNLGSPIIAPSFSFSCFIDGSLLGSSVGSIIILPQASIEQVKLLSETEASMHWKICVSLVQNYLSGLMLELSVSSLQQSIKKLNLKNIFDQPGLVRIWQGLLLVQAQLTQELLRLTSSSSFAEKVASVITKISTTSLEHADAQAGYITESLS
jgi:hypothetical protein